MAEPSTPGEEAAGPDGEGMAPDEAHELLAVLTLALNQGQDMSAWFRVHPRALLPGFGVQLRPYVRSRADIPEVAGILVFPDGAAHRALRVQRDFRRNGLPSVLARLRAARGSTWEVAALHSELNSLLAGEDLYDGDKPLQVARGFRDLAEHPYLLTCDEHQYAHLLLWGSRNLELLYRHTLSREVLDVWIQVSATGLDPAPVSAAAHAALLDQRALALTALNEQSGDVDLFRQAAELHNQALSMTSANDPKRADRLTNLAACFADLYLRAGESDGLDKAIFLYGQALKLRTTTLTRSNLAVSMVDRFRRDGAIADLNQALMAFAAIAAGTPDDDPQLPRSLWEYARALLASYQQTSDRADLDRAIELTERALALGPVGTEQAACMTLYAEALSERARLTGDRAELDRAVSLSRQAGSGLPPGSVLAEQAAGSLIAVLADRWANGRGSSRDRHELVTAARAALADMGQDRGFRVRVAAYLLIALPEYASSTSDVAELDRAIREFEEAADILAEAPGFDTVLEIDVRAGMARLHIERGRCARTLEDVERGLSLAAEIADPAARAEMISRGLTERFVLNLDATDLAQALEAAEPASRTPGEEFSLVSLGDRLDEFGGTGQRLADGRDLPGILADLWRRRSATAGPGAAAGYAFLASRAYARNFWLTGDLRDLEMGADIPEQQLSAVAPDTPRYVKLQIAAGCRWRELYTATGEPRHLTRALAHLEAARRAAGPGTSLFRLACGNLGTALRAKFNYTGELAALDRAIAEYELSLEDIPDEESSTDWPVGAANLANALRASYEYTHEEGRLDRAINLHQRVVAAYPPGNADLPQALHNLATAYTTRYNANRDPADLSRAIDANVEAVTQMAGDTALRQNVFTDLSSLSLKIFTIAEDPSCLDEAVHFSRQAVGFSGGHASSQARSLAGLAGALEDRYEHCHDDQDRVEAIALCRHMCGESQPSFGEFQLTVAWRWAIWAMRREAWPEAAEACRAGIRAFSDLVELQVSRNFRTGFIGKYRDFIADAVYALARAGDHQDAVMTLEIGRAVSISETLRLRTADLDWLRGHGHAALAEKFETAVQRWAAASGEGLDRYLAGGNQYGSRDLPDRDAAIQAARTDIDTLAIKVREVTGRAEFLRSPEFTDVAAAASPEPLVYLIAAGPGGMALIVRGPQIQVLHLTTLTRVAVTKWQADLSSAYAMGEATLNWWTRLESLGRELWNAVIGPVTETLDGGPATFVPTGHLELLPLNAAWTPDENRPSGRRYTIDDLTVRNVPNARVLAAARAKEKGSVARYRLLAVEASQSSNAPRLTSTGAEINGARCRFAESTLLSGPQASPESVITGLRNHEVVHLACHGSADPLAPLDNTLYLAGDQRLTLRDIMNIRLDPEVTIRLAVLSACETSIAGSEAPDEIISLPSGLLEAGVAGVVASQWRVSDLSAALLMIRFYAEWTGAGTDPAAALRAAQQWMRDSTNRDIAKYLTSYTLPPETGRPLWRSVIRMDPERRGFAHPAHWAGFVFSGA